MPPSYPKISERAWTVVRAKAASAPSTKFTPSLVATLGGFTSSQSASSNVVSPMQKLGLIDSDGGLTELGNRWRVDTTYPQACDEIIKAQYPDELASLTSDDGSPDFAQLKSWFQHQGFGNSSATNMATTYALIAGKVPPKPTASGNGTKQKKAPTRKSRSASQGTSIPQAGAHDVQAPTLDDNATGTSSPRLHLDIQIHIPAEASLEQIEKIFESMGKHLYGR